MCVCVCELCSPCRVSARSKHPCVPDIAAMAHHDSIHSAKRGHTAERGASCGEMSLWDGAKDAYILHPCGRPWQPRGHRQATYTHSNPCTGHGAYHPSARLRSIWFEFQEAARAILFDSEQNPAGFLFVPNRNPDRIRIRLARAGPGRSEWRPRSLSHPQASSFSSTIPWHR